MATVFRLSQTPVHLGFGAVATQQPPFDGMAWYAAYEERTASDGDEGRLVSMYTFTEPWASWEMHPRGHELVLVTAGHMTLVQERDGSEVRVELGPGEAAINDPGVWHTADVSEPTTAVFITAGAGTEHRQR